LFPQPQGLGSDEERHCGDAEAGACPVRTDTCTAPCYTLDKCADGVVLTFVNLTAAKQLEEALLAAQDDRQHELSVIKEKERIVLAKSLKSSGKELH
jgi:hypothetical protein